MLFDWDPKKAEKNLKKHRVSFEEATTVFLGGPVLELEDRDYDEQRFIVIGFSARMRVLVVVYVYRDEDVTKIISARKAEPSEVREYEKRVRF